MVANGAFADSVKSFNHHRDAVGFAARRDRGAADMYPRFFIRRQNIPKQRKMGRLPEKVGFVHGKETHDFARRKNLVNDILIFPAVSVPDIRP